MKYRSIIKMDLDLIKFILEIICLKELKNSEYVINLDEYADVGTHWIALYIKNIEINYFDSFEVEHVSKEIENTFGHKNIKTPYLEYKQTIQ